MIQLPARKENTVSKETRERVDAEIREKFGLPEKNIKK